MVVKMSRGRERETGQTDVTTNVHTRRKKQVAHQQIHNSARAPREHEYCVYALLRGAGVKKRSRQPPIDTKNSFLTTRVVSLSPSSFISPLSLVDHELLFSLSLWLLHCTHAFFVLMSPLRTFFCMSGMGVSLAHPVIHYFIHKHDKEARTFINVCHLIKIIPRPVLPAKNAKSYSYLSDRSISPLLSFYIQTDSFWL